MKRQVRIQQLGGARATILHRPHANVLALTRQLHAIGLVVDEAWPELGPQALAADFGQRAIEHAVALRAHRHEFHWQPRVRRAQPGLHVLGLPHGQLAAPGCDA